MLSFATKVYCAQDGEHAYQVNYELYFISLFSSIVKTKITYILIFIFWVLLHTYFLSINQVLKVSDSFAYLQMAHHIQNFSIDWLWTWWFGFFYSLLIAGLDKIITFFSFWLLPDTFYLNHDFYSAQVLNIILYLFWWYLLYKLARRVLTNAYIYIALILYFLSPQLLHFNINIVSENIYIPLFLYLFIKLLDFNINATWEKLSLKFFLRLLAIWWLFSVLYFIRWEAFIYILSFVLVLFFLLIFKRVSFAQFGISLILVPLFFWIFTLPYTYHLHSFTWEWGLTNKWASNFRQAQLRGTKKMDDIGFEKAVWEITKDNKHLVSWFVWGLEYDKPTIEWNVISLLLEDPSTHIKRFLINQRKLFLEMTPRIIVWQAYNYFFEKDSFISKYPVVKWGFLVLCWSILLLFLYWFIMLIKYRKLDFIVVYLSFFVIAATFFTLFFVLKRYFIIFLPIAYIVIAYWVSRLRFKVLKGISVLVLFSITSYWLFYYYNQNNSSDEYYSVKKVAWEWIKKEHSNESIRVMERFPITTYYSWVKERILTPYTNHLWRLVSYARHKKVKYLVVDSLDFKRYRPWLDYLLNESNQFNINYKGLFTWLRFIKKFEKNWQKVVLYEIR